MIFVNINQTYERNGTSSCSIVHTFLGAIPQIGSFRANLEAYGYPTNPTLTSNFKNSMGNHDFTWGKLSSFDSSKSFECVYVH